MSTTATQSALGTSSTFSVNNNASPPAAVHKRTYQACIPCRQRKVRCDLGPVDAPHDPPCVRCRREKKNCYFTPTRRKRKPGDEDEGETAGDVNEEDQAHKRRSITDGDLPDHGRRSSQFGGRRPASYLSQLDTPPLGEYNSSDANTFQYPRPLYLSPRSGTSNTAEGQEVTNETATALFRDPINNPKDALHVLIEAAGRTEDMIRQNDQANVTSSSHVRKTTDFARPARANSTGRDERLQVIDPAIANSSRVMSPSQDGGVQEALRAWSRVRFVRAGWFTAREAITYIQYFYERLAPLTPITPPDFRPLTSHPQLLNEEPMLAVTLLTIAARFKKLEGPGGQSRSSLIHEKLWNYLQKMITRMFWGQEQFGGGFCGAGALRKGQKHDKANTGKLRTLGTIESLLLLTDWHPRSMHFPPGDDDGEIIAPSESELNDDSTNNTTVSSNFAGWTEPALRSDRMCWSLIGCAYNLAYELGIFDSLNGGSWSIGDHRRGGSSAQCRRADRTARLLYIYVTQTSGRLGYPNMLPNQGSVEEFEYLRIVRPDEYAAEASDDHVLENIQRSWAEMTSLMKQSNADLFASKEMTHEIIQSRGYLKVLEYYQPKIREWLSSFESIEVPQHSRTILMIEFEYMRTYINSLSLQAVLEYCTSKANPKRTPNTRAFPSHSGHTPGALMSSQLVDMYKDNEHYIAEVVDASRNILRHVVNELLPSGCLKHAPVRTHFRILSGAMFLLKTFALGAKEEEVAISMQLLDDTIRALRISVVDDVHLCLRVADLLEGLTSNIRHKFVRLAVHGNDLRGRSSREKNQSHHKPHKSLIPNTVRNERAGGHPVGNSVTGYANDYNGVQGPLAGISKSPIDPNDSSITIMPPPDYFYSNPYPFSPTDGPQQYSPQVSPHQSHQSYPQQSYQQQQQQQQQHLPSQNQNYQTTNNSFNPTDGYHWLTLDVNPLLNTNNNNSHYPGTAGTNTWSGAFGPDIGNSLEMLDMLASDAFPGGADMGF